MMAVYPCDWSGHRYPGPQRSMYVSFATASSVETHKFRFCQRHFRDQLEYVKEHLSEIDEDSQASISCESCHADRQLAIYVKTYDLNEEPRSWAVDLCGACSALMRDSMQIAKGRALRAS